VDERQAARKAKNYKRSDEIRDQLAKTGWIIEDTPAGPRAKRVG
jgi:cysteinyl-tRNA synthetase